MGQNIQYIFIAILFAAALVYIVLRFLPSKKKKGGCAKGCGCAMTQTGDSHTAN